MRVRLADHTMINEQPLKKGKWKREEKKKSSGCPNLDGYDSLGGSVLWIKQDGTKRKKRLLLDRNSYV